MPSPAETALQSVIEQTLKPTNLTSAELAKLPLEVRHKAFFSARVGNLEFLDQARGTVQDIVDGTLDQATGRAELKKLLKKMNYEPLPGDEGTIKDLSSDRRLNLIIETNVDQARNYGQWQAGQDPTILEMYPAQELIRVGPDPTAPRPWRSKWSSAGGKFYGGRLIARKDDGIWMRSISAGGFNRFGTPYPPFDFNSGMRVRDISRREAIQLGVIKKETEVEQIKGPDFAKSQVTKSSLSPRARRAMKKFYGQQVSNTGSALQTTSKAIAKPVHDAIIPETKNKTIRGALTVVKDILDKIHGDGKLPQIPLLKISAAQRRLNRKGRYVPFDTRDIATGEFLKGGLYIHTDSQEKAALTLLHEIGHFLDVKGFQTKEKGILTSSSSPAFRSWLAEVKNSKAYSSIVANRKAGRISAKDYNYLTSIDELWARSYTQYIVSKSKNQKLKEALNSDVSINKQWTNKDFLPIGAEIHNLIQQEGWLR